MTNMTARVEICIEAVGDAGTYHAVASALRGGADSVELCGEMHADGLTPPLSSIRAARRAFGDRGSLMTMVRPRAGDFEFSDDELAEMEAQVRLAAGAGADGVVFGALRNGMPDETAVRRLVCLARDNGLITTFHRAFDAVRYPLDALEMLISEGVDRILTSGTPWGAADGALEGAARINEYLARASGRIEMVVGGGVGPSNVRELLGRLSPCAGGVMLHSYSGARRGGYVDEGLVRMLVERANDSSQRPKNTAWSR